MLSRFFGSKKKKEPSTSAVVERESDSTVNDSSATIKDSSSVPSKPISGDEAEGTSMPSMSSNKDDALDALDSVDAENGDDSTKTSIVEGHDDKEKSTLPDDRKIGEDGEDGYAKADASSLSPSSKAVAKGTEKKVSIDESQASAANESVNGKESAGEGHDMKVSSSDALDTTDTADTTTLKETAEQGGNTGADENRTTNSDALKSENNKGEVDIDDKSVSEGKKSSEQPVDSNESSPDVKKPYKKYNKKYATETSTPSGVDTFADAPIEEEIINPNDIKIVQTKVNHFRNQLEERYDKPEEASKIFFNECQIVDEHENCEQNSKHLSTFIYQEQFFKICNKLEMDVSDEDLKVIFDNFKVYDSKAKETMNDPILYYERFLTSVLNIEKSCGTLVNEMSGMLRDYLERDTKSVTKLMGYFTKYDSTSRTTQKETAISKNELRKFDTESYQKFSTSLKALSGGTFSVSDIRRMFTGLRSANQVGISDIIQTINKGGQADDPKELFSSLLKLFLIAKDSMSIDSIASSTPTATIGSNKRVDRSRSNPSSTVGMRDSMTLGYHVKELFSIQKKLISHYPINTSVVHCWYILDKILAMSSITDRQQILQRPKVKVGAIIDFITGLRSRSLSLHKYYDTIHKTLDVTSGEISRFVIDMNKMFPYIRQDPADNTTTQQKSKDSLENSITFAALTSLVSIPIDENLVIRKVGCKVNKSLLLLSSQIDETTGTTTKKVYFKISTVYINSDSVTPPLVIQSCESPRIDIDISDSSSDNVYIQWEDLEVQNILSVKLDNDTYKNPSWRVGVEIFEDQDTSHGHKVVDDGDIGSDSTATTSVAAEKKATTTTVSLASYQMNIIELIQMYVNKYAIDTSSDSTETRVPMSFPTKQSNESSSSLELSVALVPQRIGYDYTKGLAVHNESQRLLSLQGEVSNLEYLVVDIVNAMSNLRPDLSSPSSNENTPKYQSKRKALREMALKKGLVGGNEVTKGEVNENKYLKEKLKSCRESISSLESWPNIRSDLLSSPNKMRLILKATYFLYGCYIRKHIKRRQKSALVIQKVMRSVSVRTKAKRQMRAMSQYKTKKNRQMLMKNIRSKQRELDQIRVIPPNEFLNYDRMRKERAVSIIQRNWKAKRLRKHWKAKKGTASDDAAKVIEIFSSSSNTRTSQHTLLMDNISRNASLSRLDGNIEKACPLELQSDALGLAQLQRKIKDDMDKRKKNERG
jgi:hypothetical protein